MMRSTLLALSRSRWLAERMPGLPFARRAVARFMPGEELGSALDAAAVFAASGMGTVVTQLGENVGTVLEADAVAAHYDGAIATIAGRGLDSCISVKLTQLGLDVDAGRTAEHVAALAARAADYGQPLWIDIESSMYTERTIELYRSLVPRHRNLGLCLQAYLRRTATDLESLLPVTSSIRLVKGAYAESADIAFADKADVDASYARLAGRLLRHAAAHADAPAPALATHDTRLLAQIVADAAQAGVQRSAYEVQMLYGIRAPEQRRLAGDGHRVRVLISYGAAWFPWFMRRLAERPANVWFVARALVAR